jgi:hypothetical protein
MKQTFKNYNAKDKLLGSSSQTYSSVIEDGGTINVEIDVVNYDKKGEEEGRANMALSCTDGIVSFDMRNFLNEEMTAMFKDANFSMEGDNLAVPNNLTVGQELPDASFTLKSESAGMGIMNVTFNIVDRKVISKENITTDAGSYDCMVIEYLMEMKWILNQKYFVKQYVAKNAGIVRTETFKKNGKKVGRTDMSSSN